VLFVCLRIIRIHRCIVSKSQGQRISRTFFLHRKFSIFPTYRTSSVFTSPVCITLWTWNFWWKILWNWEFVTMSLNPKKCCRITADTSVLRDVSNVAVSSPGHVSRDLFPPQVWDQRRVPHQSIRWTRNCWGIQVLRVSSCSVNCFIELLSKHQLLLLTPLGRRSVWCAIHHKRDVREK